VLEFLRVVSCDKNVFANMISILQINIISCFNKDQRKTSILKNLKRHVLPTMLIPALRALTTTQSVFEDITQNFTQQSTKITTKNYTKFIKRAKFLFWQARITDPH